MHGNIVKTFDHNAAFGMLRSLCRLILSNAVKHILIRHKNRMILLIFIIHTVDNLAFL